MKSSTKAKIAIAASIFMIGASFVAPASAATKIKAGGPCTKVNSTTKISGDVYTCTKNPLVKNAKLTWVWKGCLDANKQYLDSVARLDSLKANVVAAQTKINELVAGVADDEAKAKEFDAKAALAKQKQDNALAEAAANAAKVTQYGATTTEGKAYQKNVDLWNKNANTYGLAVKNFQRAAKSLRDKAANIETEKKKLEVANQTIAAQSVQLKGADDSRKQACTPGL